MATNRWIELTEQNPGHSSWYVERFRSMVAAGDDLDGEARFIDAMLGRQSRVLDAGCGPGRVGSHLARAGHEVVGVDIDPVLIAAAEHDHPGPTWLVADLAELDLAAIGVVDGFDIAVCAGNVLDLPRPGHTQTRPRSSRGTPAHRWPHRCRVRIGTRLLVRRVLRRRRAGGARSRRAVLHMGSATVHPRLRLPRRGAVTEGIHDLIAQWRRVIGEECCRSTGSRSRRRR